MGEGENFLASDAMALAGVTDQIVYLEEGDLVDLQPGQALDRRRMAGRCSARCARCRHTRARPSWAPTATMQKEIFEQPRAIADTLEERGRHRARALRRHRRGRRPGRQRARTAFQAIDKVLILACGTDYYSGCAAKYWLEAIAKIPTDVQMLSSTTCESVPDPRRWVVTITQSGETADTLAALKRARSLGMEHTLTICNVATSAMVRECNEHITRAGVEIGDGLDQGLHHAARGPVPAHAGAGAGQGPAEQVDEARLSRRCATCLWRCSRCWRWSRRSSAGPRTSRGRRTPCSLAAGCTTRSRWKVRSSSRRSATSTPKAYPAGELKHGPLALVTSEMPVVTVAPNDALLEKLKSNLQEVRARGGVLYVLADGDTRIERGEGLHVIRMPGTTALLAAPAWCRCSCWRTTRRWRAARTSTTQKPRQERDGRVTGALGRRDGRMT